MTPAIINGLLTGIIVETVLLARQTELKLVLKTALDMSLVVSHSQLNRCLYYAPAL